MANLSSKTGFTPVQTQVSIPSLNVATNVQDFAAYEAQELTGFVYVDATADLRCSVKVMVVKNGAGTYEVASVDLAGDNYASAPLVAFSMSGSILRATLPAGIPGFAGTAYIKYQLNAPALGGQFPLTVDGSNVTAASATAQGTVTTGAQTFAGTKTFEGINIATGALEVGYGRAVAGPSLVDFTVETGAVDNNARIIRQSGANGAWDFANQGTGSFVFSSANSACFRILNGGNIEQVIGSGIKYLGVSGNNSIAFKWTSPNLIGRIDNAVDVTLANVSDHRIKRNVEDMDTPALERVAQLRPVTYQMADYGELFKASEEVHEGFIAHELQEVVPSAVHGIKDDPGQIQSLKLDALVAVLTKAVQELSAKVDAQAEEIKRLGGK